MEAQFMWPANDSSLNFDELTVSQEEEDPRMLATSYMKYKVGKFYNDQ